MGPPGGKVKNHKIMKTDIEIFKTLIALQGDGSDVYELIDGEVFPRGDVHECETENIVATFDAWKRDQHESLTVAKGSKALFCDDGKHFFHYVQTDAIDRWDEASEVDIY